MNYRLLGSTLCAVALAGGAALAWSRFQGPRTPATPAVQENVMSNLSNVIHLTTPAFPALVAQTRPVIIDFWAPWCGPCQTQGPILEAVAARMGDRAVVAKVNVDEESSLAAQFGVQAIPTLVILKQGKVVQRFVGVQQAQELVDALDHVKP